MQRNRGKNRMGKTKDIVKNMRDIQQTFHEKICTINDRNAIDLTEAEDIKRWKEYTQ